METEKVNNERPVPGTGTGITGDCIPLHIYNDLRANGWGVVKGLPKGEDKLTQKQLDEHLTALYSSRGYEKARGSFRRINELVARHFFDLGQNAARDMREDVVRLYRKALALFDIAPQRRMMIEEASELIEALVREDRGRANKEDVITELADVLIMCEQLSLVYGEKEVLQEKARKLDRLAERLKKYR